MAELSAMCSVWPTALRVICQVHTLAVSVSPGASTHPALGILPRPSPAQAGVQVIPTNQPGNVSSWSYAAVGGSLPFGPSGMPQDAASWTALQNIQLCWSLSFLAATHICRQVGEDYRPAKR